MVTLKNFVKRVADAVKVTPELQIQGKGTYINLNLLFVPLLQWDEELDLDELQCLLANLIANQLIKGYISHEKRILVLSNDAFPANPVPAMTAMVSNLVGAAAQVHQDTV